MWNVFIEGLSGLFNIYVSIGKSHEESSSNGLPTSFTKEYVCALI